MINTLKFYPYSKYFFKQQCNCCFEVPNYCGTNIERYYCPKCGKELTKIEDPIEKIKNVINTFKEQVIKNKKSNNINDDFILENEIM